MPCDGDPHSCMDWNTGGRKRDSEGQWMGGEIHSLAFKRAESIHFSVGIVSFQSKSTSFKRIPPANISLLTLSPRNCSGQMLNWWGTPLTTQKAPFVVARLRQTFLMSHVLHQACTTRGGRGRKDFHKEDSRKDLSCTMHLYHERLDLWHLEIVDY